MKNMVFHSKETYFVKQVPNIAILKPSLGHTYVLSYMDALTGAKPIRTLAAQGVKTKPILPLLVLCSVSVNQCDTYQIFRLTSRMTI